jgi:hypothetical protein
MVKLLFAMTLMVLRIYQKAHMILEMVSMIQQRELFASMMVNLNVILNQERNNGHQKSVDIIQDNSRMMNISMDHKIRSSKR